MTNAKLQKLQEKAVALKDHIYSHRARYAALVTLAGCTALQLRNGAALNAFLEEHGLLDEYYYDAESDTPPIES